MPKPRIAVFSPVPPVPSGISEYCVRWLNLLKDDVEASLFLDDYESGADVPAAIHQAAEFENLHAEQPFDLVVHQIGNAPCHDYIYPFLYRHPGLLILHDAWLMGRRLMRAVENWEGDNFRAEMAVAYGESGDSAAEIILSGLHNHYFLRHFPMIELPVRASRMTVVHEKPLAERIAREVSGAKVESVPMLVSEREFNQAARERVRAKLNIEKEQCLIGSFGLLTPDKGIAPLLAAFARVRAIQPDAVLMLAGGVGEDLPLEEMISGAGLEGQVLLTGRLPEKDFIEHMAACDLLVQLRWPTRRETSAVIIEAMQLGLPVITSDLAHMRDYPADALVRIPVVDEEKALRKVLLDLVQCPPLRKRIGETGQTFIYERHNEGTIRHRWVELIQKAIEALVPERDFLPVHLKS